MIKTVLVENEIQASNFLKDLLAKHFPEIEVAAICNTVESGVQKIKALKPQLVFLDVELDLPNTGFHLLEQTKDCSFGVIFVTSYNKYAAKAFRFCAIDFIEKPYGDEELIEAVNKFKSTPSLNAEKKKEALLYNVSHTNHLVHKIGIPVTGGLDFITLNEIIFCRADDNCTQFYLINKQKLLATKTLKWVDELLRDHQFCRVHDSYIINMHHIKKYKKGGEGGVVELTDRYEADVSRRKKEDFLKMLSDMKMIHD